MVTSPRWGWHRTWRHRTRRGHRPPDRLFRTGLGWDGRMLIMALAGLTGLLPFAYTTLAVYLGLMFVAGSVLPWAPAADEFVRGVVHGAGRRAARGLAARRIRRGARTRHGVTVDLEEEEA